MIAKDIVLLIIGFIVLIKGADWFVEASASIARQLNIPELIIGLTIVAMGTSLPEAAVSISSAKAGNAGITVGNVVGSNIMNILIILGITAAITTISVQLTTIQYEIPFLFFVTIVMAVTGYTGNKVTLTEGLLLWALFIIYLIYLYIMSQKGESDPAEDENPIHKPIWICILIIIGTIFLIIKGADLIVDGATNIAEFIGISDRIIGLTIIAFGTSLPELATCITAVRKNKADLAIGNIVGSNIFNILFVLGTTALITPVPFESGFVVDSIVAAGAVLALWLGAFQDNKLKKRAGIVMILLYAIYFLTMLL